jgi:ferritin-like metal-binding protein YciE
MKFKTLQTLYAHELQEVYNLELQLAALLAEMDQVATDENLKRTFYDHSVETQQHLERLKEIFHNLNLDPEDYSSEIRQEWVAECREMADAPGEPHVKDAALIAWAQRAEHEEIAAYGTLRTFARHLGFGRHAALLADTLEEEAAADKKLTRLAEGDWFRHGINREAAAVQ